MTDDEEQQFRSALAESINNGTIKVTDFPEIKQMIEKSIRQSVTDYTKNNLDYNQISGNLDRIIQNTVTDEVNKLNQFIKDNNQVLLNKQQGIFDGLQKNNDDLNLIEKQFDEAKLKSQNLMEQIETQKQKVKNLNRTLNNQTDTANKLAKMVTNRYIIFGTVFFALILGIFVGVVFL
ncbi:hypothetical protein ACQW5G_08700 (plasmid) [Fructilactobacillus sp. Tb1]|uniref:hypothetical protein n=1 Tax=Fructilactobacillus sp. Tb1 TaxID=3422304 RepID=UPI003D266692